MLDYLKAIIYGIVEGITEWVPVSSTGHLIILEKVMPFKNTSEGFFDVFDVVIQLGAIIATIILFFNKIWPFAFTQKEREKCGITSVFKKDKWLLWAKILVSCVPAVIVGLLFSDTADKYFYNYLSVSIALIVFGIGFLIVERVNEKRTPTVKGVSQITFKLALIIGIFQVIAAIFPGTSRSGATILGAILIGISRRTAAEYTFFLAIPVMAGASLLKIAKYILDGYTFTANEIGLLVTGSVVAFVVSLFVLSAFMKYIKNHDFRVFGWYRIGLGFLVIFLFGVLGI